VKIKLVRSFLSTVLARLGGVGICPRWWVACLVIGLEDLRALSGHGRAKRVALDSFSVLTLSNAFSEIISRLLPVGDDSTSAPSKSRLHLVPL
jgi:hypothetical protein